MDEEIKDIIDNSEFIPASSPSNSIKVIGVGGGGNNAVNNMYLKGIQGVSYVVCNTDRQALNGSPVPNKVQLGPGHGAGNIPEVGRELAEESIEAIKELFDDDTKMVFITACMGGGTGTGAGPVVARAAKDSGVLTIGIVTIPFLFEGEKKILKALDGADEMAKNVDALLIINNERLIEVYPDLDFINGFAKADDTLTTAAKSISELITREGYINVDFNDVDTTLRNGGTAIISSGYGEGEHRVSSAIEDALNSPLLKNRDILHSKKLLFNLYFSRNAEKAFSLDEVQELTSFMTKIDKDVDVIWGVAYDESLGEKVKITILAAGFNVTIREEVKEENEPESGRATIKFPGIKRPTSPTPTPNDIEKKKRLEDLYGKDKVEKTEKVRFSDRYIVLSPEQFDDDAVIEVLEQSRAYKRDNKVVEAVRNGHPDAHTLENAPLSMRVDTNSKPQSPSNGSIDFTL